MRSDLVLISSLAAVGIGAWLWLQNRSLTPTPAAVAPGAASQGLGTYFDLSDLWQPSTEPTGINWLNITTELDSLLFPESTAATAANSQYPIQGANVIQPRGISNNNPLNIEANGTQWQGATGNDGRFLIFSDVYYGIRAAARIMRTYRNSYGLNTVRGIVTRWAPPSDNNPTGNYINYVAKHAQVSADAPLSNSDYAAVIAAMIVFENGYNPYDSQTIQTAVSAGLN